MIRTRKNLIFNIIDNDRECLSIVLLNELLGEIYLKLFGRQSLE